MNNLLPPIAALLIVLFYGGGARADLALDTGFDSDGIAEVDIVPGTDITQDADGARDLAVQSDGALVLAGLSLQTVGGVTNGFVTLVRVNGTTGAPDAGFGTAGILSFLPGGTAANGGGGLARAVAIQPLDQKIVLAGAWDANGGGATEIFVARLDTNGALDPTFGSGGVSIFNPAGLTNSRANDLVLRSDGSIIVAGRGTSGDAIVGFVVGLTANGAANPAFADAIVSNPLPEGAGFGFNQLAVLPGDGILAAGGGGDLTLVRLTSGGVLDASFNGDGIASVNVLTLVNGQGQPVPQYDVATALKVLADGRILLGGTVASTADNPATDLVLARLTPGGDLDAAFGSGGYAPLSSLSSAGTPRAIGIRPSGDVVVAGEGFPPVQVSPEGIAVSPLGGTFRPDLFGAEVLGDGSIVAGGRSVFTSGNAVFAAARLTATDLADGPDTVPDPFGFATQTAIEPGVTVTSASATITGLAAPATIEVTPGDFYSIGCTDVFGSAPSTITNGQTVCLRTTAATVGSAVKTAVLRVGGIQGLFNVVTGDTTPDQFTFVDQTDVSANSVVTSAPVTLTGLTTRTEVSVQGGTFSVGCTGTYTSSPTRVDPGAQVCVRHTASGTAGGTTSTVLLVGIGPIINDTFTSTTAGDSQPDAFSFTDQTGVPKLTVITSDSVTLSGFTSDAAISVTGGSYSIGCGSNFTSSAGTIAPGSRVCVRHTSASAGGTPTSTTLTVGGVSDTFTSTTEGSTDTTPDAFSFRDQTNVPLVTEITSGTITISGFDTAAPISVAGGAYSIGCNGSFTTAAGTLPPDARVCVRHTSAIEGDTDVDTVLTVGGVSDTFTSTTLSGDAVPAPFSFTDQTGVEIFAEVVSAPVTITGIDIATPVFVAGGEYSIGCTGTFTTARGSIRNGQTVCVRHTSSINSLSNVDTTLTVGTGNDTFTSTTRAGDQTPDDFAFASKSDVALATLIESDPVTISGIDSPVTVEASGPTTGFPFNQPLYGFSIGCTGTFDGQNGDVLEPGEELCVAVQSASTDSTGVVMTVTVGGAATSGTQKSATFTVTTGDTVPEPFTFVDQVGVPLITPIYANPVEITGITAPARVEITRTGEYQVNCTGDWTRLPGSVSNGDTICVRQFSPGSLGTLTDTVLTVGGISDTFSTTTTTEAKPLPGSSAMDPWSLMGLVSLLGYGVRRRAASR